jgi:hypothetical protein
MLFSTDKMEGRSLDEQDVRAVEKCCDLMTIVVLQATDSLFLTSNQYITACAVVAASRRHCKIAPVWS